MIGQVLRSIKYIVMHIIYYLYFDFPLKRNQIPSFRGSLIKAMGITAHPLMHNHTDEGFRFGYPLVQYKVSEGKAFVVAFDEVGEFIAQFFKDHGSLPLTLHRKKCMCRLERVQSVSYSPKTSDLPCYYSISNFLPLTGDNVNEFEGLMALTDKVCFLENILTGNILSFLKGIGHFTDEHIVSVITEINDQSFVKYKGVHFRSFDLHFVSNIMLPSFIGLGKSTSVGMGIIQKIDLPEKFIKFISNEKS